MIAKDLIRKDYPKIDVKNTISELKGVFKKTKEHSALVFDGNKYLGVVSKRFLLTTRINPSEMKVGNIVKKRSKAKTPFYVPILEQETDIKKICKLMATSDSHMLPVMDKNKITGVIKIEDVLEAVANEYNKATCEELSKKIICAKQNEGLDTAIDIFVRQGIDHLPIIDDKQKLIGIASVSNIIDNPNLWDDKAQQLPNAAKHQQGKKTGYCSKEKTRKTGLPITNFMTKRTICCTPETKISKAIQQMKENNVKTIVLVKYDMLKGIMTARDILIDYAK